MNNLCSFIFEIMPQVFLLLVKVSKRSRTFITMFTQIITFSLNLGTSNKNFETIKCSLERSFQKKKEYQKKYDLPIYQFSRNFNKIEISFRPQA